MAKRSAHVERGARAPTRSPRDRTRAHAHKEARCDADRGGVGGGGGGSRSTKATAMEEVQQYEYCSAYGSTNGPSRARANTGTRPSVGVSSCGPVYSEATSSLAPTPRPQRSARGPLPPGIPRPGPPRLREPGLRGQSTGAPPPRRPTAPAQLEIAVAA
jgi:hypothetical protein